MSAIYILRNGEQAGPYTMSQLQGMWGAGAITSQTFYWQDGMSEWLALEDLVERSIPNRSPQVAPKKKLPDWTDMQFVVLVLLSILIPLIGLLVGLLALANPLKRQRGLALICVAVISMFAIAMLLPRLMS